MNNFIDIHNHVIFGVDDGSKNIDESKSILQMMKKDGVSRILATPHFYADKCISIDNRISLVKKNFNVVKEMANNECIDCKLGFEVKFFKSISSCDEIRKLCYSDSKYILIEMPYTGFSSSDIDIIYDMMYNYDIVPIMAHIERFMWCKGFNELLNLVKTTDALAQINCSSVIYNNFIEKLKCRKVYNLIKEDYISFVATDAHSVDRRPPLMKKAYDILSCTINENLAYRLFSNNIINEVQ